MMMSIHAICYGVSAMSIVLIHNVFLLFYVNVFVSVHRISQPDFYVGQLIFLIWNCVNDPLFGWITDNRSLTKDASSKTSNSARISTAVVNRRLRAVKLGGPLLCISFLLFWWPLLGKSWVGLHFIICLLLYDSALTYVDLNHAALLADVSVDSSERASINACSSVLSLMGVVSVPITYGLWNPQAMESFRMCCLCLAFLSAMGFWMSMTVLQSSLSKTWSNDGDSFLKDSPSKRKKISVNNSLHSHLNTSSSGGQVGIVKETANRRLHSFNGIDHSLKTKVETVLSPMSMKSSIVGFFAFMMSCLKQRNFLSFTAMSLLQTFHCHFNSNFFPTFLSHLLGDYVSPTAGSILLGLSFVAPHLNNVLFSSLSRQHGVYIVIWWLLVTKLVISTFMLFIGRSNLLFLSLFIVSNRVFTEGTCKLCGLVLSDLVDEDFVVNRRHESISALVISMSSFFSKPGQTLAPVLGTWFITSRVGSDTMFSLDGDPLKGSERNSDDINDVIFNMLVSVPILCAILQLLLWNFFSLHGLRLRKIKNQLLEVQEWASGYNSYYDI